MLLPGFGEQVRVVACFSTTRWCARGEILFQEVMGRRKGNWLVMREWCIMW